MRLCGHEIPMDIICMILIRIDVFGFGSFLRICKYVRDYFYNNKSVYYRVLFYVSKRLLRWDSGPRHIVQAYQDPQFYQMWLKLGMKEEEKDIPLLKVTNPQLRQLIIDYRNQCKKVPVSCYVSDDVERYKKERNNHINGISTATRFRSINILSYIISNRLVDAPKINDELLTDNFFLPIIRLLIEHYPSVFRRKWEDAVREGVLVTWHVDVLLHAWSTNIIPRIQLNIEICTTHGARSLCYLMDNNLISKEQLDSILTYMYGIQRLSMLEIGSLMRFAKKEELIEHPPIPLHPNKTTKNINALLLGYYCCSEEIEIEECAIIKKNEKIFEKIYEMFSDLVRTEQWEDDMELKILERITITDCELFIFIFNSITQYEDEQLDRYKDRIIGVVRDRRYRAYMNKLFLHLFSIPSPKKIMDILLSSRKIKSLMIGKPKRKVQVEIKSARGMRMMYLMGYISDEDVWKNQDNLDSNNLGDGKVGRICIYYRYYKDLITKIYFRMPREIRKNLNLNYWYMNLDPYDTSTSVAAQEEIPNVFRDFLTLVKNKINIIRDKAIRTQTFSISDMMKGILELRDIEKDLFKLFPPKQKNR